LHDENQIDLENNLYRNCCCCSTSALHQDQGGRQERCNLQSECVTCHGADGKGDTPAGKSTKVRSFADPEVVKASDDDLAGIIEKGKGKMPGYGKSLKPDEIKDMVAYIRGMAK
jgi:mono/diheme cytochrome c family protein